jgi:dephospho-CoA kinase
MSETLTHVFLVEPQERGTRLDRFLAGKMREFGLSREKIKDLIKNGSVSVDARVQTSPKFLLENRETVQAVTEPVSTALEPETGAIEVLYRDAALAVINKPAGLTVHPASGQPDGTLANRLVAHFPELAALEGFRPGIVHRLDKDTSGLMLVALSERCRLLLAARFAERHVFKEYLALVHGVPAKSHGRIDAPIGRHPTHKTRMAVTPGGKAAASAWRVLHADPRGRFSLLAVRIFTGRTHQVRVHMSHVGHPLLGDRVYGGTKPGAACAAGAERQMLHAWRLAFYHPLPETLPEEPRFSHLDAQGGMAFLCPPPQDFLDCIFDAARGMLRVVITGSPGSGKSALTKALQALGLPLFNADAAIAALYQPGGDGHHILRSWFGERFVPDENLPVDKNALGKAMTEDDNLRKKIEALLHPLVWHALRDFWEEKEREGHAVAIAEIPLYLENDRHLENPAPDMPPPLLVGVHCPFALRKKRLLHKRLWSETTIAKVESWQWPEEKKMRACDIVVDNTQDLSCLELEAEKLTITFTNILQERDTAMRRRLETIWNEPCAVPFPL